MVQFLFLLAVLSCFFASLLRIRASSSLAALCLLQVTYFPGLHLERKDASAPLSYSLLLLASASAVDVPLRFFANTYKQ